METLWLLTVFLVPLAFFDRDFARSEAVISYVELPKIALLRTLAGLMAVLWLIEWSIGGRLPSIYSLRSRANSSWLRPHELLKKLTSWARQRPERWLILAVWFYLGTTLLGTVLSAQFGVSMWGEVPGQDGYPAYTIMAYAVLFGVIATHLKTRPQLWRLLGAIVAAGTLISGYAVFQHYGHDFLGLTEVTGGGKGRVTSMMGNAIFAAAVMLMTIGVSLVVAVLTLRDASENSDTSRRGLGLSLRFLVLAGLWSVVLAVQVMGITFTFSRGPWLGSILAVVGFFGLLAVFGYWRTFRQAALLLGLMVAVMSAVLHWQGSASILGLGPWTGAVSALGAALAAAVLFIYWRILGRAALVLGLVAALVVGVALVPRWLDSESSAAGNQPTTIVTEVDSTASDVAARLGSIKSHVLSGAFASGRGEVWKGSWRLIRDRPWFEFDELSLPWLRPLVGYGPDLFRYTYLLESPPTDRNLIPHEPDHAHNFFINQAVDLGVLGFLSSLGIFAAVFLVGGYQLLRQRAGFSAAHLLILVMLLALFAGRFLEQMVGLARVSDLTIFWALLAVFAVLPTVMRTPNDEPGSSLLQQSSSGRDSSSGPPSPGAGAYNWQLFWRLAVVAWLIGGIGVLTWQKTVNYVRAAVLESTGVKQINRGDYQGALGSFSRVVELAPDVSYYHDNLANVYLAYQFNKNVPPERGCSAQSALPYDSCLALQSFRSNREGTAQRPFYYRSHLELAKAAFNLKVAGIAELKTNQGRISIEDSEDIVRFYRESVALVPHSWPIRNELAEAYIEAGRPESALDQLEKSLAITNGRMVSAKALFLQGIAYRDLGELKKSAESLEQSLVMQISGKLARQAHQILGEAYAGLDRQRSMADYDEAIRRNPRDAGAWNSRGKALSDLGQHRQAIEDFNEALRYDSQHDLAYANRGDAHSQLGQYDRAVQDYTAAIRIHSQFAEALGFGAPLAAIYLKRADALTMLGQYQPAVEDLNQVILSDPENPDHFIKRGDAYRQLAQHQLAIQDLDEANRLDPQDPIVYLYRGKTYYAMGQHQRAIQDFDRAIQLDPERALAFEGRAKAYGEQGRHEEAIRDHDEAIRLNSRAARLVIQDSDEALRLNSLNARVINERGEAFMKLGQYQRAIDDFDAAIGLDHKFTSTVANRAEAYRLLGRYRQAIDDYTDVIRRDPADALAFSRRGALYSELGLPMLAIVDYNRAISLDPANPMALAGRGIVRSNLGEPEVALEDLDQAILLAPHLAEAHAIRGKVQGALGRHESAFQDFDRAIELDPLYSKTYAYRGKVYSDMGEHELALGDLDEAIRLDPHNSRAYVERAAAHQQIGELEPAIQDYSEAIRLDSPFTEPFGLEAPLGFLYGLRGDLYSELGLLGPAAKDYTEAVGLIAAKEVTAALAIPLALLYKKLGSIQFEVGLYGHSLSAFTAAIRWDPELTAELEMPLALLHKKLGG